MNIEPTYVTFQQAKLLKEKGFDIYTPNAYINGIFITPEEPQNWNKTKWVFTKEGFECFGCKLDNIKYFEGFCAPEQWMVIEWLRVRYGIWINVVRTKFTVACRYQSYIEEKPLTGSMGGFISHISPQEAYSAAIDYVLTTLI